MGFRQVITRRFVDEIQINEPSEYIAFLIPSKVQSTIYSYSPKIEVARHWKINDRFSINLTGLANWRWVSLTIEETERLDLTLVDELSTWTASSDGLKFTPENPATEEVNSKEQYWAISLVPQLRYAVNSRFGLTAAFGGIELTQKVKDDVESFVRAAPTWAIRANPSTWTLGVYGIFGGGEEQFFLNRKTYLPLFNKPSLVNSISRFNLQYINSILKSTHV